MVREHGEDRSKWRTIRNTFNAVVWTPECSLDVHEMNPCPLKQTFNLSILVDMYFLGCRVSRQAGHGHDITTNNDYESCSCRQANLPNGHHVTAGCVL